jgi:hypothetical protein
MSQRDASIDPILGEVIAAAVAAAMAPVVEAMTALAAGNAAAATQALAAAKASKRPESYLGDFPYHERSAFRPLGIDGPPLPPLTCPTFLGLHEMDEGTGELIIRAAYPYVADEHGGCTFEERELLNAIVAGVYPGIRRRDGVTGIVRVQVREDADGSPYRKVIAVPKQWLSKQHKNQIGGVEFLSQVAAQAKTKVAA